MADETRIADDADLNQMRAYYSRGGEEHRLTSGNAPARLEFERTKEIILRHLPSPPAVVADIGGGPGAYALWLSSLGYRVIHRDLMPLHVAQLRHAACGDPRVETAVGDARDPGLPDGSVDAVLLLGPLYHLDQQADRLRALAAAHRMLRPGGPVFAAAISRWSPRLDGILRVRIDRNFQVLEDTIVKIEETGQLPPLAGPGSFTAYLHRPDEFRSEIADGGFEVLDLVSVEGPAFLLSDLADRFADEDEDSRRVVMETSRALERVPELLGVGPHLLATGRKPGRGISGERP